MPVIVLPKATIGACDRESFAELVTLLDREFIFSRQRRTSLATRFPHVLAPDNLDNVLMARWQGRLCASLSLRVFRWQADGREWRGAMVGMVCTAPDCRGRGLAAALLRAVPKRLEELGADFGVLWTSIPAFYVPFGWISSDHGWLGRCAGSSPAPAEDIVSPQLAEAIDPLWLESIQAAWRHSFVRRDPRDYRVIPPVCDRVICFAAHGAAGQECYALVGEQADRGLVFEIAGAPPAQRRLWRTIRSRYRDVVVNDSREDATAAWLREEPDMSWEPQRQTMWLIASRDFARSAWQRWHIPFFDRV